jgi:hypothetical protein
MIQLTVSSLLCLGIAIFFIAVACVLALLARIAASQKSAVGFFVLAITFFGVLGGLLFWVGAA